MRNFRASDKVTTFHNVVFIVRELEKKFSGKHVVFIAQRRILPKPTEKANKLKQKRPISCTLVTVHTAILDDLVSPAEMSLEKVRETLQLL